MSVDFVCSSEDAKREYNEFGYGQEELSPGAEEIGGQFYRCSLKAGCCVSPVLNSEMIIVLIFNGKKGYITTPDDMYHVTEPSFFIPDFDRVPYMVHAVEDVEYIMAVFPMNEWDKDFYERWHIHCPFFSKYSDGVQYDQDCKGPNTQSFSIIQAFQLGHISIGVVKAVGEGTDEKGHGLLHQWNYCLGNSDFTLTVEDETRPQKAGDWSFIYAGKDHKLLAEPGKEVFYVWVEYFTEEDLEKYYQYQINNGNFTEA
jgi:hypothetical protein